MSKIIGPSSTCPVNLKTSTQIETTKYKVMKEITIAANTFTIHLINLINNA